MTEQPAFRVFLSYSTKDRRMVREIYKHLAQSETIVPWFDDKILLPGLEWEREISKAVWGTDVVLICFSPRALTGRGELDDEIRYALAVAEKRGKAKPPLVVLKLEQCELPPLLHDVPTVNWYERNWDEHLIEVLQAQEIPQRPPPPMASTPAVRSGQKNEPGADASKADTPETVSRQKPASTAEGKKPSQQGQGRNSRRDTQEPREAPRKPQTTTPRGRAPTTASPQGRPWLRYIAGGAISLVIIAAVVLLWREGPGLLADEGMNGNGPVATLPPTDTNALSPSLLETSEPFAPAPQALPTKAITLTATLTPTTMLTQTLPLTPTTAITPTATAVPTPPPTPTLPLTPTVVITPTTTPVPTPSPSPTPAPPPPPTTYTVQSGDTFSAIASEYGLSVEELLQLNNMAPEEADNIRPGQEIIVSR